MDALLLIVITGFAAGAAHVCLGLDHLAALMPLSQGKSRWRALSPGVRWGLGHGHAEETGPARITVSNLYIVIGGFWLANQVIPLYSLPVSHH
ncbi:MAG: hypothetical protein JJ957_14725 [Pseudomonadales bacterium]|nr:hypothetical protein [Pseudomonadales bacterium]MBO6597035.1 hypothetical protein [Pseudomonadales bacterium]MBO6823778.1 hypothetical protein [Pseudomonadales bacterium]